MSRRVNLVTIVFALRDRKAWPWQSIAGVVLVALLAALATLQYRWLGEVRDAERERMRASLRSRLSEFAQEFDGELTRAYLAFHLTSDQLDAGEDAALADALKRWQASTKVPGLVQNIYLASGVMVDSAAVRRFDPARRALEPAEWPPALKAWLARTHQTLPRVVGTPPGPPPLMLVDTIDSRTPALIIAIPRINRSSSGGQMLFTADPKGPVRVLVVALDSARLQRDLLEPLVAKYFGEQAGAEYLLTISGRDEEGTIVYSSAPSPIEARAADGAAGMF